MEIIFTLLAVAAVVFLAVHFKVVHGATSSTQKH